MYSSINLSIYLSTYRDIHRTQTCRHENTITTVSSNQVTQQSSMLSTLSKKM